MKLLKVTLELEDQKGNRTIKSLTGEQAQKWNEFCIQVASAAEIHGMNAAWEVLNWTDEKVD